MQMVPILVFGDAKVEGNETFGLRFWQANEAALATAMAIDSILNDDVIFPLPPPVGGPSPGGGNEGGNPDGPVDPIVSQSPIVADTSVKGTVNAQLGLVVNQSSPQVFGPPPAVAADGSQEAPVAPQSAPISQLATSIERTVLAPAEQEQHIALLAYLADADQYHLIGIEPGDEVATPVAPSTVARIQSLKPLSQPAVEEVAAPPAPEEPEKSGFSLWWLLALPPLVFAGTIAGIQVTRVWSRRARVKNKTGP